MIALLLTLAIATGGYPVDVLQARQWARDHTTDRGFRCLHVLWDRESGWRVHARTGRAYGIPQSLPGRKMKAAERPERGPRWDDWRDDALVQVAWGMHYVRGRYNSSCRALRFQTLHGWY